MWNAHKNVCADVPIPTLVLTRSGSKGLPLVLRILRLPQQSPLGYERLYKKAELIEKGFGECYSVESIVSIIEYYLTLLTYLGSLIRLFYFYGILSI